MIKRRVKDDNVGNEIIDYEEIFKDQNKDSKPSKNTDSKALMSILLYFFIMIAGGVFFLANFISGVFIEPYNDERTTEIVINLVNNNEDSMGFVLLDDYNKIFKIDGEDNEEKINEFKVTAVGDILYNDVDYKLIVSENKNDSISWLLLEDEVNVDLIQDIFKGEISTWDNSEDELIFHLTIGSPLYKYLDNNYQGIDNNNSLNIIKNYSIDYSNILNFITYLFITIPVFFIFRPEITYDFMLLKKDEEPIFSKVFTGFAFMLLTSVALNLLTMLLQSFSGVGGDSVNQATIVMALQTDTRILMFLSAVVLAPIIEELVFRKAIFSLIKNPKIAILVSSITFGLIHVAAEPNLINLLVQVIPYLGMGAFLSYYYYYKTDSNIVVLILMHSASNLFSVLPLLFG